MQKGSALIFVLWIIAILAIIASEIGFNSRLNSHLAVYEASSVKNYPAILSCLNSGIKVVLSQNASELTHLTGSTFEFSLKEPEYTCELSFYDESGRYNINKATEKELLNILSSIGIEGEKKDTIVDSILDWRDSDDFHRLNGAESDYYESLNPPYKCKNGDLNSIYELTLIKGIDLEVYKKLKNIFTIYSNAGKININSATKEVLITLGIDEDIVNKILKEREGGPFLDMDDLQSRIEGIDIVDLENKITFKDSGIYKTIVKITHGGDISTGKFILKISPSGAEILDVI